jgi:hypothetical protein
MSAKKLKQIEKSFQLSDDIEKYFELLFQHLKPCGDDLILLTITGHLIIENWLEINLTRLLAIENLPSGKGRLGFSHKLNLVQAVVISREPGPNADVFCAIAEFNDLRNKVAHRLRSQEEIENDVKSFIKNNHKIFDKKLSQNWTTAKQLRIYINKLCKFLFDVRVYFHKLDQQEDE